jgi:hypothetical protein
LVHTSAQTFAPPILQIQFSAPTVSLPRVVNHAL